MIHERYTIYTHSEEFSEDSLTYESLILLSQIQLWEQLINISRDCSIPANYGGIQKLGDKSIMGHITMLLTCLTLLVVY